MNKLLTAKIGAIKAAFDAFAPLMQTTHKPTPETKRAALAETMREVTEYLQLPMPELTAVPDNAAATVAMLLELEQLQHAPEMVYSTVSELLGIALETLQKLYTLTLTAFTIQGEA
ncbi:MAG: hypothetical protein JSS64_11620 [Bacteroidetes bacterium]|nr:hypothetical protein [Bacteroidota bacterium]